MESVEEFSKRFKVLAGKAVYLGNIHFSIEQPPFVIGTGSYRMTVADQRARDLTLLHSKHPRLTPDQLVVGVDPVSWTPSHLGRRGPRCRRVMHRTRRS